MTTNDDDPDCGCVDCMARRYREFQEGKKVTFHGLPVKGFVTLTMVEQADKSLGAMVGMDEDMDTLVLVATIGSLLDILNAKLQHEREFFRGEPN